MATPTPPIPEVSWQNIVMDIIEGLLLDGRKSNTLVVIDHLRKYANFLVLSHPYIIITTVELYFTKVYKIYVALTLTVTSYGSNFISTFGNFSSSSLVLNSFIYSLPPTK